MYIGVRGLTVHKPLESVLDTVRCLSQPPYIRAHCSHYATRLARGIGAGTTSASFICSKSHVWVGSTAKAHQIYGETKKNVRKSRPAMICCRAAINYASNQRLPKTAPTAAELHSFLTLPISLAAQARYYHRHRLFTALCRGKKKLSPLSQPLSVVTDGA